MDTAQAPLSKYIFEDGVLKLGGEDVKIYYFDDAPEMPWFQVRVYKNNKSSLKELVEKKGSPILRGTSDVPRITVENLGNGNNANAYYVNEPGFYQIIFGSDKPEATDFTDWVTGVVLPTLRRTGTFSVERRPEKRKAEFDIEASALQLAKRVCADVVEQLQEAHKTNILKIVEAERMTHKNDMLQSLIQVQNTHRDDLLQLQDVHQNELWQLQEAHKNDMMQIVEAQRTTIINLPLMLGGAVNQCLTGFFATAGGGFFQTMKNVIQGARGSEEHARADSEGVRLGEECLW